jgi:DNA-binding CsgD family transcriptional regulator
MTRGSSFSCWDCCALRDSWKYAELRTNSVAPVGNFLVRRVPTMHSASDYDQCSIQAFASLKLTPREAEVLFWIARGKGNHDIGIILGAKTGTICKHVEHIFSKLNVENRTSAAVVALETCRSAASTSERKSGRSWAAVAGVIATQIADLWLNAWEICDALSLA